MDRDYDIFEEFQDGFPVWRGHASGLREARLRLFELRKITNNECFAIHLATKDIVARINVRNSKGKRPILFQITYDVDLGNARAEVLRSHGYHVISALGNDSAKAILTVPQNCDVFVIGWIARQEIRCEMASWLRDNYPGVCIIALNVPPVEELVGSDYNVKSNGPETLLPVLTAALRGGRGGSSVAV